MKKQFILSLVIISVLILSPFNISMAEDTLASRLKGRILLQVEEKGEAWYVNPANEKRYYMANGEEAYNIMRNLGVGITNKDLERVKTDKTFAKKHSGKIFLQVEENGEAFYVDVDGNAHYLKNGAEAYRIMRDLGLGITNNDLAKIEVYSNIDWSKFTNQEKDAKDYVINDFLSTVVSIDCDTQIGSGFIWGKYIMTNEHVIDDGSSVCSVDLIDEVNKTTDFFGIDVSNYDYYNLYSDFALLRIRDDDYQRISFNQNLQKINKCSEEMPIGSKVYTIGYPSYADKSIYGKDISFINRSKILSEGIISGNKRTSWDLPYFDYYISNQIDSGNSGGLALAEKNGEFCLLGTPTWISLGNYNSQGIVQNIHNIFYEE